MNASCISTAGHSGDALPLITLGRSPVPLSVGDPLRIENNEPMAAIGV
jgi:hypothetical protein